MEAKCDGCSKFYKSSELSVYYGGTFWCQDCFKNGVAPRPVKPILIQYLFPWQEINALLAYLDGSRELEVLDRIDELKAALEYETFNILKRVLRKDENGEVQEPDS